MHATWSDEVEREVAKTALSVFAVSVVGTVVTVGSDQYRRHRDERDRKMEEGREKAANERSQRDEDDRREVERVRDDRHRQDVQLRSLLQDTIRTYNEVKEVRRSSRRTRAGTKGGARSLWTCTTLGCGS